MAREASGFCECRNCGFVLQAASDGSPTPKHWDACPDCGGTDFATPGG